MMQMSTGEGKAKVLDEKETTVYKRALDQEYKLKLKASRPIFSEINKRVPHDALHRAQPGQQAGQTGACGVPQPRPPAPLPCAAREGVSKYSYGIGYSQIFAA